MSKVLKTFTVKLSRKQTREINAALDDFSTANRGIGDYFVIAQTRTKFAYHDIIHGDISFAIIPIKEGFKIAAMLEIGSTNCNTLEKTQTA